MQQLNRHFKNAVMVKTYLTLFAFTVGVHFSIYGEMYLTWMYYNNKHSSCYYI